jgi:hypothetical protein
MIFRNKAGELISIKRNHYTSDTSYYMALLETKQVTQVKQVKKMTCEHIAFILKNLKSTY